MSLFTDKDIAIIGAGNSGKSTAIDLLRKGTNRGLIIMEQDQKQIEDKFLEFLNKSIDLKMNDLQCELDGMLGGKRIVNENKKKRNRRKNKATRKQRRKNRKK